MTPRINSARVHHCATDWSWSPRSMPDFNLWTVLSGSGELKGEGLSVKLSRGTAMLFRPGSGCEASHDPQKPLSVIAVHFEFTEDERILPAMHSEARDPSMLEKLLERILAAWNADNAKHAEAWLSATLQELLEGAERLKTPSSGYEQAIDALCGEIEDSPEHPWSVPEMAERLKVCSDHFGRLFRKRKGMAPHEFALEARLDYAKSLLSSSSHSVERVAELSGYKSLSFLTRQFKAKTGLTPSAFRRGSGGS